MKNPIVASLILLGANTSTWATLLVEERFSGTFTDGALVSTYSGAATGLTGTWTGGAADFTLRNSAQYGAGYMGGILGGYTPGTAPTYVARKQGFGTSRALRSLVVPINLSVDGTIYASSFINCDGNNFRNALGFTNATNELYFGHSYNGGTRGLNAVYGALAGTNLDTGGAGVVLTGKSAAEPAAFMLATLTKTNSGTTNNLSVLLEYWNLPVADANATDISGPPTVTRTINLTGVTGSFTNLAIQTGGWSSIDDIRVGTTEADVTTGVAPSDSDGDGLADNWEQQIIDANPGDAITTINDVLPGDDYDSDNLTNLEEHDGEVISPPYTFSPTSPIDNDTDNDTLLDGNEAKGVSNSFASGNPTDPNDPDSDNDGLNDFEENGSLNVSFGNAPTNPNAIDTDGDFYSDHFEINATPASDPNSSGSVPGPGAGFHLVEDFDGAGMTIGNTFSGVNGWAGNAAAVAVADEPIAGGDQVGKFLGAPNQATIYKSLETSVLQIPQGATGTLFFQLYVGGPADHAFGLSDNSVPAGYDGLEASLFVKSGGNGYNPGDDGDSGFDHPLLGWVNVWMVVDTAANTYKIYVESPDGESGQVDITPTPIPLENGAAAGDLVSIMFIENGGAPPYFLDNIYMAPIQSLLTTPVADKPAPAEDSDSDGLADAWELANFGDLDEIGTGDPDGDYDTNEVEETAGTNPNSIFDYTDSDDGGFGLPDNWELAFFGNLDEGNDDDFEPDGLLNLDEFFAGTDPTNPDSDGDGLLDGAEYNTYFTNPVVADTDGDGLVDGDEVNTHSTDPLDPDSDGDGFNDGAEVAAGSDPNDNASTPLTVGGAIVLIDPTHNNGSFELLGGVQGAAKASHWDTDADGDVDNWTLWGAAVGGPATALNDSGTEASGAATNGTRVGYLQANNAAYNLTTAVIAEGDTFTYAWDWCQAGRGAATAQLAYQDGANIVAITGTESTGAAVDTFGTTWVVPPGHPAIGKPIAMTIRTTGNYPEVDNFILVVVPAGGPVDLKITDIHFDSGDLKITFTPGGAGYILTSSSDLATPFAEETNATYDGIDTFTVPAASLNPGAGFFRVEDAP